MAEWSIAAVLKTVVLRGTGGSIPSLSARKRQIKYSNLFEGFYLLFYCKEARGSEGMDLSIPLSPLIKRVQQMMHPLFLGTVPTSPFGRGLGDVAAISYAITLNIHVGLTSPCPPL